MSNTRGIIRQREISNTVKDFSRLRWKNITPTDIDGFIDFANRCFVVIELKYKQTEVPYGQLLAIERLVDGLGVNGKHSLGIVASYDTCGDVDVAICVVRSIRTTGKWIPITLREFTVKYIIDRFLNRFMGDYYTKGEEREQVDSQ